MKYKELLEVEVNRLQFDKKNPRLPKRLFGAEDSSVIDWMLLDASLLDLIASISNNGFFPGEPLLVVESNNSNFTVVEGNRRLASCKILNNPELASVKSKSIQNLINESNPDNIPNKLPVFLFEKREDILAYLGYRHVTGVKSWGALPKAKYLFELYELDKSENSLKDKCRELAKKIGSRSDYVLKLLTSYQLYHKIEENQFFEIKNLSEESIEFSNLVDAATRFGNVAKFINIDFDSETPIDNVDFEKLKELTTWLYKRDEDGRTMIGENRNIRLLNQIVMHEKALTDFRENKNIKDAYLLTSVPDEIFIQSIMSAIKNLSNAEEVLEHIKEFTKKNSVDNVKTIHNKIEVISSKINQS